MRSTVTALFVAVVAFAASAPAGAGSLQVEPVLVDITAPGAASTVTLRNEGTTPIDAQIRVYRWSIVNGKEKLDPTDDVVASPPSVTLTPKGQYIARIVRVSKQPVAGEESYRLLVDQLPDLSQQRNGSVNLMVRFRRFQQEEPDRGVVNRHERRQGHIDGTQQRGPTAAHLRAHAQE